MVDVKVFTDQLDEKHLDKATEAKIRKLLKNAKVITQQQASILQGIIDGAISNLSKVNTLEQLQIASAVNIFTTSAAVEALIPYQNNIGKMFQFGIKFSNAKMSETALLLEEGVKQSTQLWLTKMGEDLKKQAGDIVADGLKKGLDRNTVVNQFWINLCGCELFQSGVEFEFDGCTGFLTVIHIDRWLVNRCCTILVHLFVEFTIASDGNNEFLGEHRNAG